MFDAVASAKLHKAPSLSQPSVQLFMSKLAMPEDRPPDPTTFARQFRQKYGRDMTPAELHFYKLTKDLLDHPPEEEQGHDEAA
jgi:hypothetical protein